MMKKTLITACTLIIASSAVMAVETSVKQTPAKPQCHCPKCNCQRPPQKGTDFAKRHAEFEQRLKLTDEQKTKAKELREESFEKIKPIMDKMKEKRAEIQTLKNDSSAAGKARLEQLNKEVGALKQEAHRLRMENMKDFEAILTKEQLKELKKMKEEGRKNFDKEFKKHARPKFGSCPDGHYPPPPPVEAK